MWSCPACARRFSRRGQRHACARGSPESLLAPVPHALAVFRAVERAVAELGPVQVATTRTQVVFSAVRGFAWIWLPGRFLKEPEPTCVLSLALCRRLRSPRVKEVVSIPGGRFMHHLVFTAPLVMDAQLHAWLREAWRDAGGVDHS